MKILQTRQLNIPFYFPPMHEIIQPYKKGNVEIIHETITEKDSRNRLLSIFDFTPPGVYVNLLIDGKSVMTDTPYEQVTNIKVCDKARGDVLIGGLGIGMILTKILPKKSVNEVLIIEKSQTVIDLIVPQLQNYFKYYWKKVTIVQDDLNIVNPHIKYLAGNKFDIIYTDIQFPEPYMETRNKLVNSLEFYLKPNGWIGHWEGIETVIRQEILEGL